MGLEAVWTRFKFKRLKVEFTERSLCMNNLIVHNVNMFLSLASFYRQNFHYKYNPWVIPSQNGFITQHTSL